MAIDTENRRRSVQAYTLGIMRPVPDGTVGAPDRATAAWFYAGLTYSTAAPVAGYMNIAHYLGRRIRQKLGYDLTDTRPDFIS